MYKLGQRDIVSCQCRSNCFFIRSILGKDQRLCGVDCDLLHVEFMLFFHFKLVSGILYQKAKRKKEKRDKERKIKRDMEKWRKLQPKVHSKDRGGFRNEAASSSPFQVQNGGKPSQSFLPSQLSEESKFVQELDRRIRDDQRGGGSQFPETVVGLDNKDQEMQSRGAIKNSSGLLVEEKGDNKNKRADRKNDPEGMKNYFGGSKMVHNVMPNAKAKVEGIQKPVDEENGRWEDREKYKETCVIKQGDKQKDRVNERPLVRNHIAEASNVPPHDPPSVHTSLKVPKIEDLIAETSSRPPRKHKAQPVKDKDDQLVWVSKVPTLSVFAVSLLPPGCQRGCPHGQAVDGQPLGLTVLLEHKATSCVYNEKGNYQHEVAYGFRFVEGEGL
ncbi:hypothetical protein SASPL_101863 [Salvia splendens]|uniref:Uncharacterized protein n=1 Tax=Salvia splendens TaxID=180675 RepID=A0A8X8YQT7_SALSN|nr:hypothetical protein SASPL_101863 [Salvia splendens]